jgi:hypothetical protein
LGGTSGPLYTVFFLRLAATLGKDQQTDPETWAAALQVEGEEERKEMEEWKGGRERWGGEVDEKGKRGCYWLQNFVNIEIYR